MKEKIIIRMATSADIESVLMIVKDARKFLFDHGVPQWQQAYPAREDFQLDIDKTQLYVAEINQQVVGMAALSKEEDPNYEVVYEGAWEIVHPSIVIHRLAVSARFYGRGIGKSLIHYAEILAKHNNIKSLKADTHPLNPTMNRLLEAMGFNKVGRIILSRWQSDPVRFAYEKVLK